MMRIEGRTAVAVLAVVFLALCAVGMSDSSDAASDKTVTVYAYVDGSVVEMTGTGPDLSSAIADAVRAKGYDVELGPVNIISFNNEKAPTGKYWTIQQWLPPRGWQVVTFKNSSANFVDGTSYFLYIAERTVAGGVSSYSSPDFEPEEKAYFFIQFKEDVNSNPYVTSVLTEEQRRNGFWISGTGSNAAWAFKDACAKLGFELNMSNGVKGNIVDYDYIGWLNSFLGLSDELMSGSTMDGSWKYWSQFYWDDQTDSWVYGETMGHYDPGVVNYFALVRQITTKDDVLTNLDQDPSDAPLSKIDGSCTVTFRDWDGSVISERSVPYFGAAAAPSDPSRAPSGDTEYTFVGWDRTFDQVIGDITVTAVYRASAVSGDAPVSGVTISDASRNLGVGESFRLTASVSPSNAADKRVTWSSSDTSVATVENGIVTAVAPGTAVITVATVDGGKTAECTVTVSAIPVDSVSIDSASITVSVGKTSGLDITILPVNATEKGVKWSSSDTSVATVENGIVTAVAPGTAVITVTTVDGGKTAECTVTVRGALVESISFDRDSLALVVGEVSGISATVSPSNAQDKRLVWSSSDISVVTVENGVVTARAPGTATISATAADGSGVSASCKVTVSRVAVDSVALDRDSLTLESGESSVLEATVLPANAQDKRLVWLSSNTSVATVENGTVTAVGPGTATIVAYSADGGKSAVCTVIVMAHAEYIRLSSSFLAMQDGDSVMLIAYTGGDSGVKWSSSDPSVATVDDSGLVTIVSPRGSTTITADAGNGLVASCTVVAISFDDEDEITSASVDEADGDVYEVELTASHLEALAKIGKGFTLNTAIGSVSLSSGVLKTVGSEGSLMVSGAVLNAAQAKVAGDAVAYEYRLNNGNISKLGGTATITMPYVLKDGEDSGSIRVYCIDAEGNLEEFGCTYADGYVTFETTHFSVFLATSHDLTGGDVPDVPEDGESGSDGSSTIVLAAVAAAILVVVAAVAVVFRRRG